MARFSARAGAYRLAFLCAQIVWYLTSRNRARKIHSLPFVNFRLYYQLYIWLCNFISLYYPTRDLQRRLGLLKQGVTNFISTCIWPHEFELTVAIVDWSMIASFPEEVATTCSHKRIQESFPYPNFAPILYLECLAI